MPDSAGRNGGGEKRRDDEEEIEISLVQLDYFLDANPLGQGRKRKRERRRRILKSGQRIFVGASLLFEQMRILSGGLSRTIILERKVADEFEEGRFERIA